MKRWSIAILAMLILTPSWTGAQSSTAGDLYRSAAKAMPLDLTRDEKEILAQPLDVPLDEAAQKLADRGLRALELFDSASQMAFGDWGFDSSDATSVGRSIVGASELANMVELRARLRAAKQQFNLALEDCYNLAQFARRLSVQPSLVRQVQQNQILQKAVETAALLLPQLSAADTDAFLKGIEGLRPPIETVDVVQASKQPYLWYYGRMVDDSVFRMMSLRSEGAVANLFGLNRKPADIRDLVHDADAADVAFAEAASTFDEMIDALGQVQAERMAAVAKIEERTRESHPLVRGVVEIVNESLQLSRSQQVMLDMLRIAAAIYADPQRPIDENAASQRALPYTFESRPGGFTLSWKRPDGSESLILQVGVRSPQDMPTTSPATSQP